MTKQLNPIICVLKASNIENEKHSGIDVLKWNAHDLSHYNLKYDIETYIEFIKVKNMNELFTLINIFLNPGENYMINIEDLYYTDDYVYQAIFKLPIKDGSYNDLIEDSNKLGTQMLHEKYIVDGNMIIIKRSIINNDFNYENITIDDITDILRSQFLHDALIIHPNNNISNQQYIHDAFEINFGQSHLDNCRSHEFKFLDYRLFFHIDRNTIKNEDNLNKFASIIFKKKIYGNCLVSLCDNSDTTPTPLNLTSEIFLQIYYLSLHNYLNKTEIERKKYSRKLNMNNRSLEDQFINTENFIHNNFPEITLCPNFFYIIKKEYLKLDINLYKNMSEINIMNIINEFTSILNDTE